MSERLTHVRDIDAREYVHTMNDRSMKIRMPKMALTQRSPEGLILRNQNSSNQ